MSDKSAERVFMDRTSKQIDLNIYHFVLVSLLLHLFVMMLYLPEVGLDKSLMDKEKTLKVKLMSDLSRKNKPRQIVASEKSNNQIKKDSQFLGETNNFFERETKAKNVGAFKKAGLGVKNAKNNKVLNQEVQKQKSLKKSLSFSDLSVASNFIPNKASKSIGAVKGLENGDKSEKGDSRSSDYIKDMPLGDFTRLNTQEYEFYGFYHRIRIKLEQFWGRNIQEQAKKIFKSGRKISTGANHITSLVIRIDEKGSIIGVNIKSTSGVKELDQAAVESFNQAGPFPNPPKKMLKNGVATIEWSFVVNS